MMYLMVTILPVGRIDWTAEGTRRKVITEKFRRRLQNIVLRVVYMNIC